MMNCKGKLPEADVPGAATVTGTGDSYWTAMLLPSSQPVTEFENVSEKTELSPAERELRSPIRNSFKLRFFLKFEHRTKCERTATSR